MRTKLGRRRLCSDGERANAWLTRRTRTNRCSDVCIALSARSAGNGRRGRRTNEQLHIALTGHSSIFSIDYITHFHQLFCKWKKSATMFEDQTKVIRSFHINKENGDATLDAHSTVQC